MVMAWASRSATASTSLGPSPGATDGSPFPSGARTVRSAVLVMAWTSRAATADRPCANHSSAGGLVVLFMAWASRFAACPHTAAASLGSRPAATAESRGTQEMAPLADDPILRYDALDSRPAATADRPCA